MTPPDNEPPHDGGPPAPSGAAPAEGPDTLLHGGPTPVTRATVERPSTRPSTGGKRSRKETTSRAAAPAFSPEQMIADRYRVVRFLAKGGMGEVYEVEDTDLGERVALKTLRPRTGRDTQAQQRFKREITLQRKIAHPNVCRIFDLGWHTPDGEDSVLFLTMELVDGRTLASRLRRSGALKPADALPLIRQMAEGLQAAHQAGIIHRDFKTANVMLVEGKPGDPPRVVITDFGIARLSESDEPAVTMAGEIIGTPAYMAPEQVQGGTITHAADIYALGVVIYEMLTGRLPFQGESPFTTAVKRLTEEPTAPSLHAPDVEPRWEDTILRCLERDPRERFASAADVVTALGGDPVTLGRRAAAKQKRRRAIQAAALSLLVLIGGFAVYRLGRRGAPPPSEVTMRRSVAVLGFKNLTGDPEAAWLPAAFAEMLGSELAAGGALRLVPSESVSRLRMELGLEQLEALSAETLARVRQRLGADAVVSGSCLAIGEKGSRTLRFDLRLQDTQTGESLPPVVEEGTEQGLLELVTRAGGKLRRELGGADQLSAEEKLQIATAQPPESMLKEYVEGLDQLRRGDALSARPLLERAVAANPDYPLAHAALADAWAQLGYDNRAAAEAKRAFELRASLPLQRRLWVEGSHHQAARDFAQAIASFQDLVDRYPDDLEAGLRLSAVLAQAGRGQDALGQLALLHQLPPPNGEDLRIDLGEADAAESISDFQASRDAARRAAEKARQLGSRTLRAEALLKEGWALRNLGERQPARTAVEEARTLYAATGDRRGEAQAATLLAVMLRDGGDARGAAVLDEASLAVFRSTGDQRSVARALNNVAKDLSLEGALGEAALRYGEALSVVRDIDDRPGLARQLNNLGEIETLRGNLTAARQHFGEALALCRELGDRRICSDVLRGAGDVLLEQGELQAARERYREALTIARDIGHKRYTALALYGLAAADLQAGDLASARRGHQEAERLRQELGEARHLAASRLALAELALLEDRPRDAAELAQRARGSLAGQASPDLEAAALALEVKAALRSGGPAQAPLAALDALAATTQNPRLRIAAALARLAAANAGSAGAAKAAAERALAEAQERGLALAALDLELSLAALEARSGGRAAVEAVLTRIERDATARGLLLHARRAAAVGRPG